MQHIRSIHTHTHTGSTHTHSHIRSQIEFSCCSPESKRMRLSFCLSGRCEWLCQPVCVLVCLQVCVRMPQILCALCGNVFMPKSFGMPRIRSIASAQHQHQHLYANANASQAQFAYLQSSMAYFQAEAAVANRGTGQIQGTRHTRHRHLDELSNSTSSRRFVVGF